MMQRWCRMMRRGLWPVVLPVMLLTGGCAALQPSQPVTLSGVAYRSLPWQVRVARLPEGMSGPALQQWLQARLDVVNGALSTYQPDTELMHFNRAPAGVWFTVSPLLLHTVRRAQEVSQATDGRYDITVAPLVNLWGFGPGARRDRVPDEAELTAVRTRVGWQHLDVDVPGAALRRRQPVSLDLSSVGEGAGVDDLAAALTDLGIKDYLVSIAGSLRSQGQRPDGQPWRVAVERPDGSGRVEQVLRRVDGAISTSGSYRNYFERDGVRYSHTIDPATGKPITHAGVSVTVVIPDGGDVTLADAWATALNVMGPDAGLALAEARGLAVYYIVRSDAGFQARHSSAFAPLLAP